MTPRPRRRTVPRPAPPRPAPPRIAADDDAPPADDADSGLAPPPRAPGGVPVVGIGASAGGLEVFQELLSALPGDTGLAFVFLLHLTRDHGSQLPDILSRHTEMPVRQAADGMAVEPNALYTNPPGSFVTVEGDVLRTRPRPSHEAPLTTVDVFFRSLAEARGERAVGVVLSGSADDGSDGVRAIDAAGGLVLVQEPGSGDHARMPQAAIDTGAAHFVLPPGELAGKLAEIVADPALLAPADAPPPDAGPRFDDESMLRVFELLGDAGGVDFTHYKRPTIRRRLHRRMLLNRTADVAEYVRLLEGSHEEAAKLFRDVLIHVTRFFRDPESFDLLKTEIFPKALERRPEGEPLRVWVAGCSTGEEAYSVAMALLEALGEERRRVPAQVFATDVSEESVETARRGEYPASIVGEVSAERLDRFFARTDDGTYRVRPFVRDLCVFARQDLTRDPPFSRLDLVVCRNVLIYLGPPLQQRLMSIFHYGLKPGGVLLLGSAESVGPRSDLFAPLHKKRKAFVRQDRAVRPHVDFPLEGRVRAAAAAGAGGGRSAPARVQGEVTRALLARYAPPGVVVDGEGTILQFRGQTGRFLEPPAGEPTLNVLRMARPGLLHGLRTALEAARAADPEEPVRRSGLQVRSDGEVRTVDLEVIPLEGEDGRYFLATFAEPAEAPAPPAANASAGDGADGRDGPAAGDLARMRRELLAGRTHMQSVINDLEAANEELQSANEEILSSNEELQSTNEELDTAKEELQSTNEELNTVNAELQERNEELGHANADLNNLLANVQIAIVIVSADLHVRRFTPMAGRVLNLIPGDVGRPLSQINPNIDVPDLGARIRQVIEDVEPFERDVRDEKGRWYSLRVRPYTDTDKRIDGAVLSLFDIDELRRREDDLQAARDLGEAVIDTIRQPLVVLNDDLLVRRVNHAFRATFGLGPAQTVGKSLAEAAGGAFDIPELLARLDRVRGNDDSKTEFRLAHEFPGLGDRKLDIVARRVDPDDEAHEPLILLVMEDAGPPRSGD